MYKRQPYNGEESECTLNIRLLDTSLAELIDLDGLQVTIVILLQRRADDLVNCKQDGFSPREEECLMNDIV